MEGGQIVEQGLDNPQTECCRRWQKAMIKRELLFSLTVAEAGRRYAAVTLSKVEDDGIADPRNPPQSTSTHISHTASSSTCFEVLSQPVAIISAISQKYLSGPDGRKQVAAMISLPVGLPAVVRSPMIALMGAALGTSISPSLLQQAYEWLLPIAGMVLLSIFGGGLSWLYFNKIGRLDPVTAFFSAMPGGVIEMVMLGGAHGGDEKIIALVHASRIFIVVLVTPFLVSLISGEAIGARTALYLPLSSLDWSASSWLLFCMGAGSVLGAILRFPAYPLLGPMAVSGLLHYFDVMNIHTPSMLLWAAQVVIGCSIGLRFAGVPLARLLLTFFLSIGSVAILLSSATIFAVGVYALTGIAIPSLLLAYSPGGLAEMSIVALTLHIAVPFVVTHHVLRVILVILGASTVFGFFVVQKQTK
ncbi:AbrB family transcriptional regulator [Rhizobium puerariae]|uniref:AbrB family transcriptional regulator n=1 Tax=Rhizobium puerariae TaxID=1585791 RepID=A0ABV6AIT0_9HYPH